MPTLTIFAGVNGAGKTSLYNEISKNMYAEDMGIRVCADEVLKALNLDWSNGEDQARSGKETAKLLRYCLDNRLSFNWELTIITPFILNKIKQAHALGYTINLYFIGVENVTLSLKRIKKRMLLGGHGVDEALVRTRHELQFDYLYEALQYVNCAFFYDNLNHIDLVGTYFSNNLEIIDETSWIKRFNNGIYSTNNNFTERYQEAFKRAIEEVNKNLQTTIKSEHTNKKNTD